MWRIAAPFEGTIDAAQRYEFATGTLGALPRARQNGHNCPNMDKREKCRLALNQQFEPTNEPFARDIAQDRVFQMDAFENAGLGFSRNQQIVDWPVPKHVPETGMQSLARGVRTNQRRESRNAWRGRSDSFALCERVMSRKMAAS